MTKTNVRFNIRTNIPFEGGFCMNWIKNNVSILLILGIMLLFVGTGIDKLIQEQQIEEITVESGDTLWSLAQQHGGQMNPRTWIYHVKEANAIVNDKIVAGNTLVIPANVKNLNQMELASKQ